MLRTSDLDYDLPQELIATTAVEPRDSARLLVVSRSDSSRLEHRRVRDLPSLLRAGDCLVFNSTRVVPARLVGRRADTGGRVEGLCLHPPAGTAEEWVAMLQGKSLRAGVTVELLDASERACGVTLELAAKAEERGAWAVRVRGAPGETGAAALERAGWTPLPPYILKARRSAGMTVGDSTDRERYQTVYARAPGSVAAPTAGLHFTAGLLESLARTGVERVDVTLHVGTGTFLPVSAEFVEQHGMHSEWCGMSSGACAAVEAARAGGRRVICVGTTSARTVESFAAARPMGEAMETRLLITPGYAWRWTDGLLTNFHLPRSTLLAMVAALFPGGVERVREIYAAAIAARYRFYSFGDAMLILP